MSSTVHIWQMQSHHCAAAQGYSRYHDNFCIDALQCAARGLVELQSLRKPICRFLRFLRPHLKWYSPWNLILSMVKERYWMFRKSAMKSKKNGAWLSEHELPRKTDIATEPHHSSKEKTERRLNRNLQTAHKQRRYQLPVLSSGRRSSRFDREQQTSLQIQKQRRNKTELHQPTSSKLLEQPTARSYWCRHCQQLQVKTWQVLADNIRYGTISRHFSPMTFKFKFKYLPRTSTSDSSDG